VRPSYPPRDQYRFRPLQTGSQYTDLYSNHSPALSHHTLALIKNTSQLPDFYQPFTNTVIFWERGALQSMHLSCTNWIGNLYLYMLTVTTFISQLL